MHLNRECTYPDLSNLFVHSDVTEAVGAIVDSVPKWISEQIEMLQGPVPHVPIGPHCMTPYECPFMARCWATLLPHQAHTLKPHQVSTFKFTTDPAAEDKIYDVVGLYLNPPTNAVVLSLDEKTQIQALSRTQPLLPLRPGLPARQTHEYRRNGLTSLYAALDMKPSPENAIRELQSQVMKALHLPLRFHLLTTSEFGGSPASRAPVIQSHGSWHC